MDTISVDLKTLQASLKAGLEDLFPDRIWVRAEVASVSARANGHCYLELSQDEDGMTVAKVRAVIWKSKYVMLARYFQETVGKPLAAGMTVLVRVQVTYSEIWGLTLVIDDIDPQVTTGERELARRRTVGRLEAEGLLTRQQELSMSELPYSLAVISARDAAGFGDFVNHLKDNEFGFAFRVDLFEAAMQGTGAPPSVVDALGRVQAAPVAYDAVLIMRGGGSDLDLDCFDDYDMCRAIALCPIPVFTAIGHDRDHHVADMVSFTAVKTPTALADEFISCLAAEDERISSYGHRLRVAFINKIAALSSKVDMMEARIKGADPRNIISRGYVLAVDGHGVVVKSASSLQVGDKVSIMLKDGRVGCRVTDKDED